METADRAAGDRTTGERGGRTSVTLLRTAAGLFFLGALLMLIGGVAEEEGGMILAGLLQGVAWWCFATCANRREAGRAD